MYSEWPASWVECPNPAGLSLTNFTFSVARGEEIGRDYLLIFFMETGIRLWGLRRV